MIALGFDTSNYTTSVACFSQSGLRENASRLLPVKPGALGLRQSDAVFAHVNALPALCEEVLARMEEPPCAVGVSIFPRRVEGSYMPCFKVGELAARVQDRFSIRQDGLFFSLSGMENQVKARLAHAVPEEIAGFVLCSVADILARVTATAQKQFGALPVLVSGGVAGSRIVRERLSGAMFCPPRFSSDNALGIAALAARAFLKEN